MAPAVYYITPCYIHASFLEFNTHEGKLGCLAFGFFLLVTSLRLYLKTCRLRRFEKGFFSVRRAFHHGTIVRRSSSSFVADEWKLDILHVFFFWRLEILDIHLFQSLILWHLVGCLVVLCFHIYILIIVHQLQICLWNFQWITSIGGHATGFLRGDRSDWARSAKLQRDLTLVCFAHTQVLNLAV